METVSMLDLRRDAEGVLAKVKKGQRLLLTYRGKPVARLEPVETAHVAADDPFYRLHELAVAEGESLTNADIDRIVYEP